MTRKYLLSGLGVIGIFLLAVVYIVTNVLSTPLLRHTPTITVVMPRTGGLFEGSAATYRGVKVGKVTSLTLTKDGAEAKVKITSDVKIPASGIAKVRSLSPVGEQYIDFEPTGSGGPYLQDGSVIKGESLDLPQTLGNTAITLDKLIASVDPTKVKEVLDEVSAGLSGSEHDLQLLVNQGSDLVKELEGAMPTLQAVLVNGGTVLRIGSDYSPNLIKLAHNSKELAAWLKKNAPTLFHLIDKAPGQIKTFQGLLVDAQDTLPQLFDPDISLNTLLAAHDPHIRALLQHYPDGFLALAAAIRSGKGHLDVILDHPQQCNYGTSERGPRDTSRHPVEENGQCSRSLTISQRGAQWAPPPLG